jgi:hypothetical protein
MAALLAPLLRYVRKLETVKLAKMGAFVAAFNQPCFPATRLRALLAPKKTHPQA